MSETGAPAASTNQEGKACAYCRRRKRSCDKLLPRCTACSSRNLECVYPSTPDRMRSGSPQTTALRVQTSSRPPLTPAHHIQSFPAVYFLDYRIYERSRMQLPQTNWTAAPVIVEFVGDAVSLARDYWEKVHWWIPIISRTHFYDHALNPLVSRSIDVLLLLSTMRLVLWHPENEPQQVEEYKATRHALSQAETEGILTVSLLQAKILLAIYEFGHAMYPAAYLSVGSCARYGTALGVKQCLNTKNFPASPEALLIMEEKRRAWWAILMLDRIMQLGNPEQMLCTEEPTLHSYLPVDDVMFESGIITQEPLWATSPASVELGMFARMSQATYLLGRVLRFHAQNSNLEDEDLRRSERLQLDTTLRALLNLVYIENSTKLIPVCAQTSICYSALITLHDPEDRRIDAEHFDLAMGYLRPVVNEMAWASGIWFGERFTYISDASPFLISWAYQAIPIYQRLQKYYGDEAQRHMLLMKEKLAIMSRRWKAGEAYQQILEARDILRIDKGNSI